MRKIILILLFLPIISKSQGFYYYKDKKIEITEIKNKAYLQYSNFNIEEEQPYLEKLGWKVTSWSVRNGMKEFVSFDKEKTSTIFFDVYIESSENTPLPSKDNIIFSEYFVKKVKGKNQAIPSPLFFVELKNLSDFDKLEEVAKRLNVDILGNNKYMQQFYTLRQKGIPYTNSITISKSFYETGFFTSCEPDLMSLHSTVVNASSCTNDPAFNQQWGLNNSTTAGVDMNICNAWNITKGDNNIIVAVIDEGIELDHPDLEDNIYYLSYDAVTDASPSQVYTNHGTMCAGVTGAVDNNSIGMAGVAPNIRLMSISTPFYPTPGASIQYIANGISFAWKNGADVISNSYVGSQTSIVDNALNNALDSGRDGRGCVMVFATGNSDDPVDYPANFHPDFIAVGAINIDGNRAVWDGGAASNYGDGLDIVAPGNDIYSTDLNDSYTSSFGGTSAACPAVSGVAALILSVNPCLSSKAVHDIICKSGKKLSNYTFSGTPNRDPRLGEWNNEVGHGLIDAEACLIIASRLTLYLQNKAEMTVKNYSYINIEAGKEVDPNSDIGNYVIGANADITLQANENIYLRDGFQGAGGCEFLARINPVSLCNFSAPMMLTGIVYKDNNDITNNYSLKNEKSIIKAYPNPTNKAIDLEINFDKKSNLEYYIFDLNGKKIYTEKSMEEKGIHVKNILVFENLPQGIYILKICIDNKCNSINIIKDEK